MKKKLLQGVTLLELLVVLVVISIISTIAVGVYTKEIVRAKYAKARAEIRTLEIAIAQYEVDTGQLPPSGSGPGLAPNNFVAGNPNEGSGYLQLALRSSLNGDLRDPLSPLWNGPYVDFDYNRLGSVDGTPITDDSFSGNPGEISFLDPFGSAYIYIRFDDYDQGGAELPSSNPFSATETYYNPTTYQIISPGANGTTGAGVDFGTEPDDISNFSSPTI